MDLRKFHAFFIVCSSALALLFGVWALGASSLEGSSRLAAGGGGFLVGAALLIYEAWFLRASRRPR